jgi:polyisoprenoid-binding protein YceI
MLGPKVLDAARFPAISFQSTRVAGKPVGSGVYELELQGELTVRGVARPLTLPLRVELAEDRLVAHGRTSLRQSDFGITPISVAGVVKVKDELAIDYEIVARAED